MHNRIIHKVHNSVKVGSFKYFQSCRNGHQSIIRWIQASVTRKKLPNVNKSCPKNSVIGYWPPHWQLPGSNWPLISRLVLFQAKKLCKIFRKASLLGMKIWTRATTRSPDQRMFRTRPRPNPGNRTAASRPCLTWPSQPRTSSARRRLGRSTKPASPSWKSIQVNWWENNNF